MALGTVSADRSVGSARTDARDGAAAPPAATTDARLSLLRGFELVYDGAHVPVPPAAERLIAFLALSGRRLLRAYVAGVLWIDSSQEAANASLRTTLWRLRQPARPIVEATASHLSLARGIAVDVHLLSACAARVLRDTGDGAEPDGAGQLTELLEAGELLPDWYDDWVVIERERFRQRRLHALESICRRLSECGHYALAVEAGLGAVAVEPLRESAHRAVMLAHLAQGNRGEALRQYELCRRLLGEQLGLDPTPETAALRARCGSRDAVVTGER